MTTDRRTFLGTTAAGLAGMSLLPTPAFAFGSRRAPARIGVIGVGRQGREIMGELGKYEGVEITAIADTDERRLDSGVRRTRGAQGFSTHQALLEKTDLYDAVCVATPTHTHLEVSKDAIAAGTNVYCEAPLEATIENAQALVRAARASGKVFQVGFDARSNPVYQLARSFYRSDAVRDLVNVYGQRHQKTTWRFPSNDPTREKLLNWRLDPEISLGLAGEWGAHQYDTVCWFHGRYPTSVRGYGSIRLHDDGREVADTVSCQFRFENGVIMDYDATLANSYGGRFETMFGTNAAIKLAQTHAWMFKEADAPTQGWEVYANRQQFHNDEGITLIAGATQLAEQGKLQEGVGLPNPPLYYALGDFLKSVTEGAEVVCSADEGYRSTVLAICGAKAVATGEQVAIGDDLMRVS